MAKSKIAKPKLTKLERKLTRQVKDQLARITAQSFTQDSNHAKVAELRDQIAELKKRIRTGRSRIQRLHDCVLTILDVKYPQRHSVKRDSCKECGHPEYEPEICDELRFIMLVEEKIDPIMQELDGETMFNVGTRFTR